tara:strand:+ start:1175 stop:1438 length:264 start_codon:yes stop_codon:yes gene_type:complete
MLKKVWYYIFNKKEENNMPDITQKTIKLLRDEIANQHSRIEIADDRISSLQLRISKLVDEKMLLQNQINSLQESVAQDIKYLYEKVN